MKINILLFGSLTELIGQSQVSLETDSMADVQHLHTYLVKKYPALEGKIFQYAVNQEIAVAGHPLHEGDEIALLPPFSGG